MTTKAEPWQIVLMLFNIDVIFTHFILLFSRFDIIAAYGLIKLCKKGLGAPFYCAPACGWKGGTQYQRGVVSPPSAAAKTVQPGLRPVGNAPLSPPAAVLPPEGEVCSPFLLVLTYVAHFIAPLESPPPGETPPQAAEGVHFHAREGGWPVFPRAKPGCKGFIQTGAPSF